MKNQLIKILNHYGITATRFADAIGVQRSSISHILSGRNKPSYDFILGIIEKYPSINPSWLLTGKGDMLLDAIESGTTVDSARAKSIITPPPDSNEISGNTDQSEYKQKTTDISKQQMVITNVNNIDHIILLFTDGTFIEYKKREDK